MLGLSERVFETVSHGRWRSHAPPGGQGGIETPQNGVVEQRSSSPCLPTTYQRENRHGSGCRSWDFINPFFKTTGCQYGVGDRDETRPCYEGDEGHETPRDETTCSL